MAAPQTLWWDHSHYGAAGWTLTLPVKHGAWLSSGLTTLMSLAGSACWAIAAYSIHQARASSQPNSAMDEEIQVMLRNSTSAGGDAWNFFCMARAWFGIRKRFAPKLLLYLLVPATIQIVFIVLGVFISSIVAVPGYDTSRVLAKAGVCGVPSINSSDPNGPFVWAYKVSNDTQVARSYAQQCYRGSQSSAVCDTLPVAALNNYTRGMVECPWPNDRCVLPEGAYQMDSGFINSHFDLGINARREDRVEVRFINTCSIITYKDVVQLVPDNTTAGLYQFIRIYLGAVPGVYNYTYEISTHSEDSDLPYSVTAVYANAGNTGGISAIPAVYRDDADQTFVFIGPQSVTYDATSSDPMFLATGAFLEAEGRIGPDSYVHVMACMDQRVIRNPVNGLETPPLGFSQVGTPAAWTQLGFNTAQIATTMRLVMNMETTDTYNTVDGQNSAALQATGLLSQLFSPGLPDDQWQIELRGWFETGLAKFQRAVAQFVNDTWVADSGYPSTTVSLFTPDDIADEDTRKAFQSQCRNQIGRSLASYQSFSMLGVVLVAVLSSSMVILSWCMSKIVRSCTSRSANVKHKYYADVMHGKLTLLMVALKAAGYNDWRTVIGNNRTNTHTDNPLRGCCDEDIRRPLLVNGNVCYPPAPQQQNAVAQVAGQHAAAADGGQGAVYGGPVGQPTVAANQRGRATTARQNATHLQVSGGDVHDTGRSDSTQGDRKLGNVTEIEMSHFSNGGSSTSRGEGSGSSRGEGSGSSRGGGNGSFRY